MERGPAPILDYDGDPNDFVGNLNLQDPFTCPEVVVMGILGPVVGAYARRVQAPRCGEIDLATMAYPVWNITRRGHSIGLVECPVGAPAAAIIMESVIGCGARRVILTGSCGTMIPLAEGEFCIPVKALRDEGTSYHYLPPGEWVETSTALNDVIEQTVRSRGLPVRRVTAWTTDGFRRETPARVADRRGRGCEVVEMECASLAAVAHFREIEFGQLLFSADSLESDYDPRGWGVGVHTRALDLALDAGFAA